MPYGIDGDNPIAAKPARVMALTAFLAPAFTPCRRFASCHAADAVRPCGPAKIDAVYHLIAIAITSLSAKGTLAHKTTGVL